MATSSALTAVRPELRNTLDAQQHELFEPYFNQAIATASAYFDTGSGVKPSVLGVS